MATDKELSAVSRVLETSAREFNHAAKSMAKVTDQLSSSGVDDFTKKLKESMKQLGLLTDEQADQIKTSKKLNDVLSSLEDQYDLIRKIEKEHAAAVAKSTKGLKMSAEKLEEVSRAELESLLETKKYRGKVTKEEFELIRQKLPLLRQEISASEKNIKHSQRLGKELEGLTTSTKNQVASFATLGTALGLFKKAITSGYDQMVRLSNKGMLGALTTIQLSSAKLFMSVQEFEEVVNRNRDIVNQLGGGAEGVKKFADEMGTVREELKYLGPAASKAAARLIETSKKGGLGPNDKQYRQNIQATIKQFKQFNGLFGDTYEDYANLMESQLEEEQLKRRMNSMSKSQIASQMEELRQRTQNAKLMGLSNQQIVDFNAKVAALVDPRKNDISERAAQGEMTKMAALEQIRLLKAAGDDQSLALARDMEANLATFNKMIQLQAEGRSKEFQDMMASEAGMKAQRAFAASAAGVDNKTNQFQRAARNTYLENNPLAQTMLAKGDALGTAKTEGRNIAENPEVKNMLKAAENMQKGLDTIFGKTVNWAEAIDKATMAAKTWENILTNPLLTAAAGLVAMFASLALGTKGITAAFNFASKAVVGAGNLIKGGITTTINSLKTLMKGFLGKLGGFGAAAMAIWDTASTDTETYGKRFGMETGNSLLGDIGVRTLGFASDLGNAATFGLAGDYLYRDKQSTGSTPPPTPQKPAQQAAAAQLPKAVTSAGDPLSKVASGMSDPKERAAFMAQMQHESGGGKNMQENLNYSSVARIRDVFGKNAAVRGMSDSDLKMYTNNPEALGNLVYGGRMGNQGEGFKYRGRGYIQLTGKQNYDKYGKLLGVDLVNNPDLAADPQIAAQIAQSYWKENNLGAKAKAGDFAGVTQAINGGQTGAAHRTALYNQHLSAYSGMPDMSPVNSFTGAPVTTMAGATAMAEGGSSMSKTETELEKQTRLLTIIASNATQKGKFSAFEDSYQANSGTVMNGMS